MLGCMCACWDACVHVGVHMLGCVYGQLDPEKAGKGQDQAVCPTLSLCPGPRPDTRPPRTSQRTKKLLGALRRLVGTMGTVRKPRSFQPPCGSGCPALLPPRQSPLQPRAALSCTLTLRRHRLAEGPSSSVHQQHVPETHQDPAPLPLAPPFSGPTLIAIHVELFNTANVREELERLLMTAFHPSRRRQVGLGGREPLAAQPACPAQPRAARSWPGDAGQTLPICRQLEPRGRGPGRLSSVTETRRSLQFLQPWARLPTATPPSDRQTDRGCWAEFRLNPNVFPTDNRKY